MMMKSAPVYSSLFFLVLFAFVSLEASSVQLLSEPPANVERFRKATAYDWCDCALGEASVSVWAGDDASEKVSISTKNATWISFDAPVDEVKWQCSGSSAISSTKLAVPSKLWSTQLTFEKKPWPCSKNSGRLRWNAWIGSNRSQYETTSTPFSSLQKGYACVKIPVLLRTSKGTLLAFSEARRDNCSDFARTDLLLRRSTDGGNSWGKMTVLATPPDGQPGSEGVCGNSLVVGNAAPVQVPASAPKHPGRILVPHTHNNFEVWSVHSDDDGATFSKPRKIPNVTVGSPQGLDCGRNLSYFGIGSKVSYLDWLEQIVKADKDPYQEFKSVLRGTWQFVGLGPPGSIALRASGRIVVPGYHSYIRGLPGGTAGAGIGLPISQLYNNLAFGHILISDDGGDTYRLSSRNGLGNGQGRGANEMQLVELKNGSVLANSRSFSTGTPQFRVQSISNDGGETFSPSVFVDDLPEPFDGCEGSIAASNDGSMLWFAHTNSAPNSGIAPWIVDMLGGKVNLTGRDHMTLWRSKDQGATYDRMQLLDDGASGYVSIQVFDNKLYAFYEQSDDAANSLSHMGIEALIGSLTVLDPDRLILRVIPI